MRLHRHALLLSAAVLLGGCSSGTDDTEEDVLEAPPGRDRDDLMYDPLEESAPTSYVVQLSPLNDSGVSGRATVEVTEDGMVVTVATRGFDDEVAHLQHLHARGDGRCPTATGAGGDPMTTQDVEEVAGAALVSLTTEGDVDAASQLDLERFPVPVDGEVGYARTFEIPPPLQLSDLPDAVLVQHGLPGYDGAANEYDGAPAPSTDPAIPLEATLPVTCGELEPAEAVDDSAP